MNHMRAHVRMRTVVDASLGACPFDGIDEVTLRREVLLVQKLHCEPMDHAIVTVAVWFSCLCGKARRSRWFIFLITLISVLIG